MTITFSQPHRAHTETDNRDIYSLHWNWVGSQGTDSVYEDFVARIKYLKQG